MAVNDCFEVIRGRYADEESGDGALEDEVLSSEGWGNVMYIP